MPITASQMATNTAEATIHYSNGEVKAVFYPDKVNNKMYAQLNNGDADDFDRGLCDLIKSWDVLEDDGSMTPITPERLADLSMPFKLQVARAIGSFIRPNSEMA